MARELAQHMYLKASRRVEAIKAKTNGKAIDPMAKENPYKEEMKAAEAYLQHAVKTNNGGRIREMLNLSKGDLAISYKSFDTHNYLIPVTNGVVNLRSGTLIEHSRDFYFTKRMPVTFDPSATCPTWEQALFTIMGGGKSVMVTPEEQALKDASAWRCCRFLQETIGLALTGDVSEHALVIFWGDGRNGKGVILETLLAMFDAYGTKLTQNAIMQTAFEQHPTELADLFGRRFLLTSETDKGRKLNLGMVKELSGGDSIKARRMRENFWTFLPTHHLFLSTNHRPVVDIDDAVWERIFLLPFVRTFVRPEDLADKRKEGKDALIRDPELKTKLMQELPGILNWAITGCMRWLQDGLTIPQEVVAATKSYRADEDVIGRFLDEACYVIPDASVNVTALFNAYKTWAAQNNEDRERLSRTHFGDVLQKKGFVKHKPDTKWLWKGIGLPADDHQDY